MCQRTNQNTTQWVALWLVALRGQSAKIARPHRESPPLQDEAVEEWRGAQRQVQVRLSADQIDDLVAAYKAGAPCRGLAEQFGVNESTVYSHLKRRRVSKRPFRKLYAEQLQEAIDLYESGESLRSVAAVVGTSPETVRAAFAVAGVPVRGRGRST